MEWLTRTQGSKGPESRVPHCDVIAIYQHGNFWQPEGQ